MESKVKYLIDDALKLQAVGSANITATGNSSFVDINQIIYGRGDVLNRFGEGSFDVLLHINTFDRTTGDETYVVNFSTADQANANVTTQESYSLIPVTDVGRTMVFKFDTSTLRGVDADGGKFVLAWVLGGTTPILNYWSYIVPNKRWG